MTFKRYWIRFKQLWKIFWSPEEEFDKKYLERRVRDNTKEIMLMKVKDRFKYIKSIEEKVLLETLEEKSQLEKKLEEINKEIKHYEKIPSYT